MFLFGTLTAIGQREPVSVSLIGNAGFNPQFLLGAGVSVEHTWKYTEGSFLTHGTGPVYLQLKGGIQIANFIGYAGYSYHLFATKGSKGSELNGWKFLYGGKYRYYLDDNKFVSGELQSDGKNFNKIISIGFTIK